ncbi:MAG: pseudouridine synthase [Deltaproteobacteria bacterium]
MAELRLQKILAAAGICSRRKAEELIARGQVAVDGEVVTELGRRVDPRLHTITCQGEPVSAAKEKIYLLLNKPKGYVTTVRDPQGRPIVLDLVKEVGARLFPVGRLDQDTSGALLLTNDGDFAQKILHPRYEIERTYRAEVAGRPTAEKLRELKTGIVIDGQRTWPARIRVLGRKGVAATVIEVIIHEGKKRQVRRMFDAIGHPVQELCRTAYGGLQLGTIAVGSYRRLLKGDLEKIFSKKKQ